MNNKSRQAKSTEYAESGSFPIVDQSSSFICGYHDDSTKLIQTDLPLTVFGDHTRHTKFISFPFIAGADGTQLLKSRRGIDDKFFYYLVASAAEKIGSYGYDRHFKHLKEFPCEYPEQKSEQTKIAEVLSTVDRAIEQTEALIAKQQHIKTGLMQDLLTRGIDEYGNLRSEETHEFKNSPLGRIPVEWEVKPCTSICKQIAVGIVIRPVQYYRPNGVPMLRSANVKENRIDPSNLVYMSTVDNDKLSKSQIFSGDLVTVRTGYPGTTAVVPPEFDGCNCVDVVISRPDRDQIRSVFLSIWINSDHGKRQVLEGQGGLAQQHFNVGEMRTLLVKTPPLCEQEAIERTLLRQAAVLRDLESSFSKLRSLKTALMQDLLTGEKRVTPLLEAG